MVDPDAYSSKENQVQLTEVERADLEHAIELERSNARFYAAMANARRQRGALKRLQAALAHRGRALLALLQAGGRRRSPRTWASPSEASADWCDDIAESLSREQTASAFYAEAAGRATNGRVAEVLSAVSAIERDHIELDGVAAELRRVLSRARVAFSAVRARRSSRTRV